MADHNFESDVTKWLETAEFLREQDPSAVTESFISHHIADIYTLLEKKEKQTGRKLKEEVEKEQQELVSLKQRIANIGSHGNDGSDSGGQQIDVFAIWYSLKNNEWSVAFNTLLLHTDMPVKIILEHLLLILKTSFEKCVQRMDMSKEEVMFHAMFPGGDRQDKFNQLPKTLNEDLSKMCAYSQEKTVQFCLPSIAMSISKEITQDKAMARVFKVESEAVRQAYANYLNKCVEFSWIACLAEPQIFLITDPKTKCDKTLHSQFVGLKEVSSKSYVEWPALVQGGQVKVPWHLYYHKGQSRPLPSLPKERPATPPKLTEPIYERKETPEGHNIYKYEVNEQAESEKIYEYNAKGLPMKLSPHPSNIAGQVIIGAGARHQGGSTESPTRHTKYHSQGRPGTKQPNNAKLSNTPRTIQNKDLSVVKKKENVNF